MSIEKAKKLHNAIQRSLDIGESSANDAMLMRLWLADLDLVLAGQKPQTDAVASWISGDDDYFLGDFLS